MIGRCAVRDLCDWIKEISVAEKKPNKSKEPEKVVRIRQALNSVGSDLEKQKIQATFASSIPLRLFRLSQVEGLARDGAVIEYKTTFLNKLPSWRLPNLVEREAKYAIKLAKSDRDLYHEEITKIITICSKIHAMRWIGLPVNEALDEEFRAAVLSRFAAQDSDAKQIVDSFLEDWNRDLWWNQSED